MGITINCSEVANQIVEFESEEKLQEGASTIDFIVGSVGHTLTSEKIQLMQALQLEGFRVHVDYSDEMHVNLSEQFCEENSVRFILQVQQDSAKLLFLDRFGYLAAGGQPSN